MVVAGNCPEPEELGAFIDGNLTGPERDDIQKHLVECEDCYAVFSGSVRFLQSETAPVLTRPRFGRRKVYAVAASLAAAAAAVFFIARTPALDFLTNWTITAERAVLTWAVDERMGRLGDQGSFGSLSDATWQSSENIFAFVGALSPEKRAFRLGVQLVDLAVSLRGNNPDRASGALGRISSLVAPSESLHGADVVIEENQNRLEAGTAPQELSGLASEIEAAAQGRVDETYFSLGKWAEAGRLAALDGNTEYFDEARHEAYLQALQELDLPSELTRELETLAVLLQQEDPELDGIERALTQIILLN